jgi:hypothetical protein
VKIHETRPLQDLDLEVSLLSAEIHHLTEREEFDVEMPADLDQFRGKNSHGAIIRGEGLVQLGHDPPDGRRSFRQIDVVSRVCEVKGRLHPCNAAADDQDRSCDLALTHKPFPFDSARLFR